MKPELFNDEKSAERIYLHPENIEEELAKNPSWMNYYSSQAAKWQAIADQKKVEAKERRGNLAKTLKASGEKYTATDITNEQDCDPVYVKLIKDHHKAAEQAAHFTGAHYALDKKQFSLQVLRKRNDREEQVTKSISYVGSDETYEEKKARLLGSIADI